MSKIQLPAQRFAAEFGAASEDGKSRKVTWQTGAAMDRMSWDGRYQLTLSMKPDHVRMGRLQSGSAPFLKDHGSYTIDNVMGVIESASVDGKTGTADVRFSDRAEFQPLIADINAGIIRNLSVGASIHRLKDVTPAQKDENSPKPMKQYLAIDWEPMEISAVAIGADPGARFAAESLEKFEVEVEPSDEQDVVTRATAHTKEKAMEEKTITAGKEEEKPVENKPAAVAAANNVDTEALKAEGAKQERERISGITQKCKAANIPNAETFAQQLINENVTLSGAADKILAELERVHKETATRSPNSATIARDAQQTKCEAIVSALMHRYDPGGQKLREDARPFQHMSLLRLAEEFLIDRGVNPRGMSKDAIAARALERENFAGFEGISDFPAVLADVANKTLRQAYQQTSRTFVNVFRQATATDFKNLNRMQLGEAPQLLVVGPSGEFKYGSMGDAKETYKLLTYGRIVALNRQTIVNDDLDAFSRIPAGYGMQAANLESDIVWSIITANAAMSDSVAIFHATHKNLISAAAGAPDVPQLSAARKLLRQMKGIDGSTLLNVQGKYLVVPSALETNAEQLVAQSIPLVPTTVGTTVPLWFRSLTPVVEPRLDANSLTAWYLFGDYNQIDTVEYAYLEGQEGVYIETRMGFNVDGIEIKARLDFGAKAIDFRGMVKNVGA